MPRLTRAAAIVLILVLAAVLRVRGIGHDSLWGDEGLGYRIAKMNLVDLVRFDIAWEQIPPVHHLILYAMIRLFGESEFWLRLPSALAGVASVFMIDVLVRRLLPGPHGRRAGLIAALIIAISPVMIEYAQEARAYSLMVLLALISTDLFLRLQRSPTSRLHVAYVLVSTLLIYTHLHGIFALLAQHLIAVWLLWRSHGRTEAKTALTPRAWIIDNLAIAALYSPWVPVVLQWVRMVNVNFWVKEASWDDISASYWVYAGSTWLLVAMVALAVLGVRSLWRRQPAALPLLLALAVLPVLIPAAASVLGRPSYAPRYGMIACIGLYPLVAAGIVAVPWWVLRAPILVAVVALALNARNGEAVNIPKERWRDGLSYLDAHARPGDDVAIHPKATTRLYDYYMRRDDLARRGFDGSALPFSLPRPPGRQTWFIVRGGWATLGEMLSRGPWRVVSHRWFDDILVMRVEEQEPSSTAASPSTAGTITSP